MHRLATLLILLLAPAGASQTTPPDVLADSVRQRLQVELRHLKQTDQRVRYMVEYGTFSPCVADSIGRVLSELPTEEYIAMSQQLRAEAQERTTPAERAVLLQNMQDADRHMIERLRAIIAEHGWPSDERTGAEVSPVVFLLHAPQAIDEMRPMLLEEVAAGRLPARQFAMAVDKSRKVRGELQLYGTGDEYDPETESIQPPRVADIDATNVARAEIGLDPLERYRLAE